MNELVAHTSTWLQMVLAQVPDKIRAVYVEYGDAYTPTMIHLVCFNAFGFELLAQGSFDPSNRDHVYELGDFTWEPSGVAGRILDCSFCHDEYPGADWMAVLLNAARSPEVKKLAKLHRLQLVVGEHDGDVHVIC